MLCWCAVLWLKQNNHGETWWKSWRHSVTARGLLAWSSWFSLGSRVDCGQQRWCPEAPPSWRTEAEGRGFLKPLAANCVSVDSMDMEVLVQVP